MLNNYKYLKYKQKYLLSKYNKYMKAGSYEELSNEEENKKKIFYQLILKKFIRTEEQEKENLEEIEKQEK